MFQELHEQYQHLFYWMQIQKLSFK